MIEIVLMIIVIPTRREDHVTVNRISQQNKKMVQMAYCDLFHAIHKEATNVSQHVFVVLLWEILMSPLKSILTGLWFLCNYFYF